MRVPFIRAAVRVVHGRAIMTALPELVNLDRRADRLCIMAAGFARTCPSNHDQHEEKQQLTDPTQTDRPRPDPDVTATLEFLPAEERARFAPVSSPLYCQIDCAAVPADHFHKPQYDDWMWDCVWTFDATGGVPADLPIDAQGIFAQPEALDGSLSPGAEFRLRHGRRILARGRITGVVNLAESARRAREQWELRPNPVGWSADLPATDDETECLLKILAETGDPIDARKAAQRIVDRGAKALRTVLRQAPGEGHGFRRRIRAILDALAEDPIALLADALSDPDPAVRRGAVLELRNRGDYAAAAAVALGRVLRDEPEELGPDARDALRVIGAPAIPVVAELISDATADVRARRLAAEGLEGDADHTPVARAALGVLLDTAEDLGLRRAVAEHLWRYARGHAAAEELRHAVEASDPETRALAEEALRRLECARERIGDP